MSDQGNAPQYPWLAEVLGTSQSGTPTAAFLAVFEEIVRALYALTQATASGPASISTIDLSAITAPATPPAGHFIIFMDIADGKVKALGPDGTLTDIANP